MQDSSGKLRIRDIRGSKTEHIGIADRFTTQAGSQRITDHTPEARVGSAIRFQGGGVVVGFHFKADILLFIKGDDAGIISEYAYTPVFFSQ